MFELKEPKNIQATPLLTVQDFLQLPLGEGDVTSELIAGEVVPKMSPIFFHAKLTRTFLILLESWRMERGEVCPEGTVLLQRQGGDRVPVPDVLYVFYDRLPDNLID